jgi:hypothetical protein
MTGSLPIVIGLQSQGEFVGFDPWGLREFLEAQFRARRECYPHSPFVLHIRAESAVRVIAAAAASACDIPVVEAPAGPLALFCHLLIDITELAQADAQPTPSGTEPLEGDLLEFEAELKVEVIRLQLSSAAAQVRQRISRFGVDGPAHDRLVQPKPDNRLMDRTDRFNRDASQRAEVPTVPGGTEPTIEGLYSLADALALRFQRKIHGAFRVVFVLAGIAAVFYGCFTTVASTTVQSQNVALVGYVILIGVSYGVFHYARRRDLHSRFIEYRALAEGLRVQHYWRACGLARSTAACYLVRQPLEYQWIRLALWRVAAAYPPVANASGADEPPAAGVLQGWIDDQEQYFSRTQARSARLESRLRVLVKCIFLFGLFASLAYMAAPHLHVPKPDQLRISLVGFLCPAISAALVALVTKLGLVYQSTHYGRMQAVYDQARRRLRRHPSGATARIAIALGEEALLENESWAQFRRERGMDEPANPFRRPW